MDDDKDAIPISTSEAYHLLLPLKSRHINVRSEAFQIYKKTLDYTESFCRIQDRSVIADLRSTLGDLGFNQTEIATMISLLPQSADEAKICIPSIVRLNDDLIDQAIKKIARTV